jgi:hypothetical protein
MRNAGFVAACGIAALLLGGCSLFTDVFRPTVPPAARRSFAAAVERAAFAREQAALNAKANAANEAKKHRGQLYPDGPPTLDDVRAAFDELYDGVRGEADAKAKQQAVDVEIESTGGLFAVVGKFAAKNGLLNSGMALAALGLTADSIYEPSTTKTAHIKAESMFSCVDTELSSVTEADRQRAMRAADNGADKAATAVRDAIGLIDSAITRYRERVLGQNLAAPTAADFDRFTKEYAQRAAEAASAAASGVADQQRAERLRSLAKAEIIAALPPGQQETDAKELRRTILNAANVNDKNALVKKLDEAQEAADKAAANAAGAKFIDLGTRLEACLARLQ